MNNIELFDVCGWHWNFWTGTYNVVNFWEINHEQ